MKKQTGGRRGLPVWRTALGLLAAVALTSHTAFGFAAKFLSFDSGTDEGSVARFSYSASIDSVSAISFTNADFWSKPTGTDEGVVAMNTPRYVDLSVRNYTEKSGVTLVSEVATKYTLELTLPRLFGGDIAFQLVDEKEDALLPQIVLTDLLACENGGTFDTSKSVDYQEKGELEKSFSVRKDGGRYAATSEDGCIVTVEEIERKAVKQTLYFRVWDVKSLGQAQVGEGDGGTLLAPLEMDYTEDLPCYKITLFLPQFVLSAGKTDFARYKIFLTTTKALKDSYLGANLYPDESLGKLTTVSSDYGEATRQPWYIVKGEGKKKIYADEVRQRVKNAESGETEIRRYTKDSPLQLYEDNVQCYHVSECYSKTYPMTMRAVFEQTN